MICFRIKAFVYKAFPVTYFRRAAVLVRELFAPGWGDVPGIHALVLYAGAGLVFLALSCTIRCRDFNILKSMFCKKFDFFDFSRCCGYGMCIPDPGSWFLHILDPGSQNSNKREGWKKLLTYLFCSHKFHKIKYYLFLKCWRKIWDGGSIMKMYCSAVRWLTKFVERLAATAAHWVRIQEVLLTAYLIVIKQRQYATLFTVSEPVR